MKKNLIIIVTLLTLLLTGCAKAEEIKNSSSNFNITPKSESNSLEAIVPEEKDWKELQSKMFETVAHEVGGYKKNYGVDILDISFPYTIICYIYNDFTVLYDKETEEIVCVRDSKEIGPRNKIEKKILEDYLSEKNHNLYYSYLVENETGISFNIVPLWENIEGQAHLVKDNSGKINLSSNFPSSFGVMETYNESTSHYNTTYFSNDGKLYSYLTPKPFSYRYVLHIDQHCIPYKMSSIDVFQENFTLDTVEYGFEDLEDFTIVLYQVIESENVTLLYACAQIDDSYKAIIWSSLPSEKLNMEAYVKYAYDIQNCELSSFFNDYYRFQGRTPYEKCYIVPFSVLMEILENNF